MQVEITTNSQKPPVAGQQYYTLSSRVFGIENLNPTVTNHQWTKNGVLLMNPPSYNNYYSITTLRLSDRGRYEYTLTITSNYLSGEYNISGFLNVTIQSKLQLL